MPMPSIFGLYAQLAAKITRADALADSAQDARTTPAEAAEMNQTASGLRKEACDHARHASENEALVEDLERLIGFITQSAHKSARRTIVQRKLEEASDQLRRECGDSAQHIINGKHHPHG